MALSSTNNHYTTLFSNANDAMSSMFKVVFLNGRFHGQEKTVRCTGFKVAHLRQLEYTKRFVTAQIDVPAPKIEGERMFQLTFRVDENYDIYKDLLNWRNLLVDPSKQAVDTDIKGNNKYFSDIQVYRIGNNGGEEGIATYNKCWCTDVTLSSFNTSNSSPMTCTATIFYTDCNDWTNADSGIYRDNAQIKGKKDGTTSRKNIFTDGTTVEPKTNL